MRSVGGGSETALERSSRLMDKVVVPCPSNLNVRLRCIPGRNDYKIGVNVNLSGLSADFTCIASQAI